MFLIVHENKPFFWKNCDLAKKINSFYFRLSDDLENYDCLKNWLYLHMMVLKICNEKWNFNCNGIMWLPVEKFGSGISEKMFLLFYLSSWEIMIFLPCFVCHIVCKCLIHRVSCLENKKIDTNSKSQLGLCLAKFSFVLGLKKGIYLSHMYMTCWMVIGF